MKTINFLLAALLCTVSASAQTMFKYFTPDDFAARRAKLMEQIGDGVAVLQGANLTEAYIKFRQDNNFYYLTGVEMPWCTVMINGKTKTTTLFVPEGRFADIKDEALIAVGPEAAKTYKVNSVLP